jgi:hypothetical protein
MFGAPRMRMGIAAMLAVLAAIGGASPAPGATATTLKALSTANSTASWTTMNTTWTDVPGATISFAVPPGTTDLFLARYTAESVCYGTSGWGSVRIVMVVPTIPASPLIEMDPASGSDYAFDTTSPPYLYQGHALERSKSYTAPAGLFGTTVTLKVQALVTGPTTLRLDDWHFTVEQLQ